MKQNNKILQMAIALLIPSFTIVTLGNLISASPILANAFGILSSDKLVFPIFLTELTKYFARENSEWDAVLGIVSTIVFATVLLAVLFAIGGEKKKSSKVMLFICIAFALDGAAILACDCFKLRICGELDYLYSQYGFVELFTMPIRYNKLRKLKMAKK